MRAPVLPRPLVGDELSSNEEIANLPSILIVDDDPFIARSLARLLKSHARNLDLARSATEALEKLGESAYDVIVSDIAMPGGSGLELLAAARSRDLDLPVIFVTGDLAVDTATRALEYGAFRYLIKPVDPTALVRAVAEAACMRRLAREREPIGALSSRASLERALRNAVATLEIVYQPIVTAKCQSVWGFEALMRPRTSSFSTPLTLLEAASKLGALRLVGRSVRARIAEDLEARPLDAPIFVNAHTADLADPDLYEDSAPLSRFAGRIVLELNESASIETLPELEARIAALRSLGYRFAVDELGRGFAGPTFFGMISPDFVKLDETLVRDIHIDPARHRMARSLTELARTLGIETIAVGIEHANERERLVEIGCTYLQGFELARPGPAFPQQLRSSQSSS